MIKNKTKKLTLILIFLILPNELIAQFGRNKVQYEDFEWFVKRTTHFEIYYYEGEENIAEYATKIAEEAYKDLSEIFKHNFKKPVPLVLYKSQRHFQQTNITTEILTEGIGGFTEILKTRVVIPFMGSYNDLKHVIKHELVHAFQFDMLYGDDLSPKMFGLMTFSIPLWFSEGMAECLSTEQTAEGHIILRDFIIEGYLKSSSDFYKINGYPAYKVGESFMNYRIKTYGRNSIGTLMRAVSAYRDIINSFKKVYGKTLEDIVDEWLNFLKRRYLPDIALMDDINSFARKLTEHTNTGNIYNMAPAISPDGKYIAYFSDEDLYSSIYLISTEKETYKKKIVKGERTGKFESLHPYSSRITWSPSGDTIAFIAQSGKDDAIYFYSLNKGEVVGLKILDKLDGARSPSFSNDGSKIAFTGFDKGESDIFYYDLKKDEIIKLTNNQYEEYDISWFPDGSAILFVSDGPYQDTLHPDFGDFNIFWVGLDTKEPFLLYESEGNEYAPHLSKDNKVMFYITDIEDNYILVRLDLDKRKTELILDITGGVFTPSWSSNSDYFAFSSFNKLGWDVYIMTAPEERKSIFAEESKEARKALNELLQKRQEQTKSKLIAAQEAEKMKEKKEKMKNDSVKVSIEQEFFDTLGNLKNTYKTGFPYLQDSLKLKQLTIEEIENVEYKGPTPDTINSEPEPYSLKFTTDWFFGSLYYSSSFGLGGQGIVSFSDILGDHQFMVSANIESKPFSDSDFLLLYWYLKKRKDIGIGLYKQTYALFRIYSGANFEDYYQYLYIPEDYLIERVGGAILMANYPFDMYKRLEFGLSYQEKTREFFGSDITEKELRILPPYERLILPMVSFSFDNSLWGSTGPIAGQRTYLYLEGTSKYLGSNREYYSTVFDFRKYAFLGLYNTFAVRLALAYSGGKNPEEFFIGGPETIRGFGYFNFTGNHVGIINLEHRFIFIKNLNLTWPIPVDLNYLRGSIFTDLGWAWSPDQPFKVFSRDEQNRLVLDDVNMSFGFGLRFNLIFFILRLDWAWRTNLVEVSEPYFHFAIGPEF